MRLDDRVRDKVGQLSRNALAGFDGMQSFVTPRQRLRVGTGSHCTLAQRLALRLPRLAATAEDPALTTSH